MSDQNAKKELPSAEERALAAAKIIADNKGSQIKILDLREITRVFDYFVIANGSSRRQLHAISDEIDDYFEKNLGDKRRTVEGYQESRWIVLDYDDVVVHLFEPEQREFYALDELWGKGKEVPFQEPEAAPVETFAAEPVSSESAPSEQNSTEFDSAELNS